MALVRWDPTRELDSLQGEMNRLFSSFFDTPAPAGNGTTNGGAPAALDPRDGPRRDARTTSC